MKPTDFKIGDEFIIKVKITDTPEEAVDDLQRHLYLNLRICKGVVIQTLYNINYPIEQVKNQMKIEVLKVLTRELENL